MRTTSWARRARRGAVVLCALAALALPAASTAQEIQLRGPLATRFVPDPAVRAHLELVPRVGVLTRADTGTVAAYGYDAGAAPAVGLDVHLLAPLGRCYSCMLHHGLALGLTYAAGPTLGAFHAAAYQQYVGDLGYAFRMELPCLRRQDRRVFLTGLLGVSAQWADAGEGDVTYGTSADANNRAGYAQRFDHFSLGWRLGGMLDMHLDNVVLGFGIDVRDLYGVATEVSRTFLLAASARVGFDLRL
jgi:hypothetical protein